MPFIFFVVCLDMETERQTLYEAVDAAVDFVRARGGRREEHLLDVPSRVRAAVEDGVHEGAAMALTMAQVRSGHELRHFVGFLEGENILDHGHLLDGFEEAATAVVAEISADDIVEEAT